MSSIELSPVPSGSERKKDHNSLCEFQATHSLVGRVNVEDTPQLEQCSQIYRQIHIYIN